MFLVSMQFLPPLHLMCVLCTIHWTELYRSLRALGEKWYVESIVFYYVNYYCFKVEQPIHHESHQSCGWLKGQSQSVHKIDIYTIYLYLNNNKKIQSYLIRNKNKFLHTLQGSTYNLTTLWTHRQNHTQNKWKILCMDLSCTTSIPVYSHLTLKTAIWLYCQPILNPVSESSTHSLQNQMCLFLLTSRPGSYVHKSTHCHYL